MTTEVNILALDARGHWFVYVYDEESIPKLAETIHAHVVSTGGLKRTDADTLLSRLSVPTKEQPR